MRPDIRRDNWFVDPQDETAGVPSASFERTQACGIFGLAPEEAPNIKTKLCYGIRLDDIGTWTLFTRIENARGYLRTMAPGIDREAALRDLETWNPRPHPCARPRP